MKLEKVYGNAGHVIRNNLINVQLQLMRLKRKHSEKETASYDEKLGIQS